MASWESFYGGRYSRKFLLKFFHLEEEQAMMNSFEAYAPTPQEVEAFKEKKENSKAEQKNLFLIIFQVF